MSITTTTDRRSLLGGLLAALTGGSVAVTEAGGVDGEPSPGTDASLIAWCVRKWGAAAVADALVESLHAAGRWDARDVKRRLQRADQRTRRHRQASDRRERHAGDEVLYRGPVRLHQEFIGRHVRNVANRSVLVGETDREYVLAGIAVPRSAIHDVLARDDEGARIVDRSPDARAVAIPAGSRVLADLRRGMAEVMVGEVVRTADGRMRLHLWTASATREECESVPCLRGGTAYETPSQRPVGLLGIPLACPTTPETTEQREAR